MFLTKTELKELTGYAYPSRQRKWLAHHGYRHDVRADGSPALLRSEVYQHLLSDNQEQPPHG